MSISKEFIDENFEEIKKNKKKEFPKKRKLPENFTKELPNEFPKISEAVPKELPKTY